jgi:hypothetical protein
MPCIDVYEREWNLRREEGFARQMGNDNAVLTAREKDGWVVKLGVDFSNDVDGLCLEFL